jgi:hypothetical protein
MHALHSMNASSSGSACEEVPPVNVGEDVGAGVAGAASDHLIPTPAPDPPPSDVKRTKTLPDLAVKTLGTVVPLNFPKRLPFQEVPSYTST